MIPEKLAWTWRGKAIDLGFAARGQGPTVLLLPALSSISTRRRHAAQVARRDGGACGAPRRPQHSSAARQAVRARGVPRRHGCGDRAAAARTRKRDALMTRAPPLVRVDFIDLLFYRLFEY